jgi:hypothetical protein
MPGKKAAPGSGGRRRTHFCYVPTPNGHKWPAHVAGPCHWVLGHEVNRKSKVCPAWFTDDELTCEWCSPINAPIEIGYQPLYRQADGKPVLVVVKDPERPDIDKLKFHGRVIVAREREASAGLYVRTALEKEPLYQSTLPERHAVPDITHSMLALWGIPAVKAWYSRTQFQSDNPMSLPPGVAVKDDGRPYSPGMQAAAKRYGADVVQDGPFAEEYEELLNRVKQKEGVATPSKNGKHKRTE